MSFTRYGAHAELGTAIHAREDVATLADLAATMPALFAYPASGDMLAMLKRGTRHQTTKRRALAQAIRRGDK